MARIPGVGRASASPSWEKKEESESDVVLLSPKDPDRWEKCVSKKMGTYFIPEGGKRLPGVGKQVSKLQGRGSALLPPSRSVPGFLPCSAVLHSSAPRSPSLHLPGEAGSWKES